MKKVISFLALAMLTMSAWAANSYVKMTSVDQLEAGKKYILVNEEANVGMGALSTTSTVYGTTAAITIESNAVDIEGTDVMVLTAHKANGDQGGWIFEFDENHYLAWVSGNSLTSTHNTTGVASLNEQWYAAATDNGVILKNRNDQSRILQYNASSPRFACYTSNQKPAVLYVEGTPEDEGITMLSQANALENGENFTFNGNAVVTFFKSGYLFLRDESGYGQIKGLTEGAFENGQVLNPGWEGVKTSNEYGWAWYTNPANLSVSNETNAELAAAQKLTGTPDVSMANAYVYVENVTISGGPMPGMPMRSLPLPDGNSIAVTSTLWGTNWPAGGAKNVYGILCKTGDALTFNVAGFENYVEPPTVLRGDADDDGEVAIADVSVLVDYLLGNPVDPFNALNADADEDGEIAIADISALVDYLLNGTWD